MTTHELAKILLEKPNVTVVAQDGADPSDWNEVTRVSDSNLNDEFWDGDNWLTGPHVKIE